MRRDGAHFGGGVYCWNACNVKAVQNTFNNCFGWHGGAMGTSNHCSGLVEDNTFTNCVGEYGGAVSVSNLCVATFESNTFYGNEGLVAGGTIDSHNGSNVDIRNCIVANSTGTAALYCWEGGLVISDCNDFWGNSSDFYGCAAGPNDFFSDPMLCDPAAGNFYIDCQSPCNGYPGCGLVGGHGVGCGSTRTEPTTWGAIKAMYR